MRCDSRGVTARGPSLVSCLRNANQLIRRFKEIRFAFRDNQRPPEQARFLDYEREQFLVADLALVQTHLLVGGTLGRNDIVCGQLERFQERAQLVDREFLFEKVALLVRDFLVRKVPLRVPARASGRAEIDLNLRLGHQSSCCLRRFAMIMSGLPNPLASGIIPTIAYPSFW